MNILELWARTHGEPHKSHGSFKEFTDMINRQVRKPDVLLISREAWEDIVKDVESEYEKRLNSPFVGEFGSEQLVE